MSASRHPSEAMLVSFASGALDEASLLVVATHLALCDTCAAMARLADTVGGALLEDLPDSPLRPDALGRTFAAISTAPVERNPPRGIASDAMMTKLPGPIGNRALPPWRRVAGGLYRIQVLARRPGRAGLDLIRVDAGRAMPRHSHGSRELTCVLQGAYRDEFGRVAAGDLVEHDRHDVHRPVAEPGEPCVCLFALEHPLRLHGIARLFQPFIGF